MLLPANMTKKKTVTFNNDDWDQYLKLKANRVGVL
jgi:hypothetical protein